MQRSTAQNRKFSAMVGDVAAARWLGPWKKTIQREAFKRYFIAIWVREARIEAYANGLPDPFPDLTARSSELDTEQFSDLIECTYAVVASRLDLILD